MLTDIFGYLGAFFLVTTLLPQIKKTYQEKKMDDFSYGFFAIQVMTCSCFLIYGILLGEIPLIIANTIVLSQTFLLINFKIRYSYLRKIVEEPGVIDGSQTLTI